MLPFHYKHIEHVKEFDAQQIIFIQPEANTCIHFNILPFITHKEVITLQGGI